MGLDMYLYASRYIPAGDEDKYRRAVELAELESYARFPSATIEVTVGYWRKANAIHKWFVDNCQNGIDECQKAEVERHQLVELRDVCKRVLEASRTEKGKVVVAGTKAGWKKLVEDGDVIVNPEVAQELLPTQSGFFFGGTDYDELYLVDLADTVELIDKLLEAVPEDDYSVDFAYRSSW